MAGLESRNTQDTPLTEFDCKIFTEFYYGFLSKTEEEKIDLLKALTLLRQGQRRPFVHRLMEERALAESLFPSRQERNLLLTFPSTIETVWSIVEDYRRQSGKEEVSNELRSMVMGQIAQVEIAGNELNHMLEQLRPIPPKEKFELSITFANTGRLKPRALSNYKMLLIVLVDRPFLCILPEDKPSTMALGKLRSYIDQAFGDELSNLQIEFFTVGGGHLKKEEKAEIGGSDIIFDVIFDDQAATTETFQQYNHAKFGLITDILGEEFPNETFVLDQI